MRVNTLCSTQAGRGLATLMTEAGLAGVETTDVALHGAVKRYERSVNTVSRRFQLSIKRVGDIVVAAACLVITSVPLVLLIVAIRLESEGPALLRQRRLGKYG